MGTRQEKPKNQGEKREELRRAGVGVLPSGLPLTLLEVLEGFPKEGFLVWEGNKDGRRLQSEM